MKYEVKAGAVADPPEGDGDIYLVIFAGPDAQMRAEEYANWKNQSERDLYGDRVNAGL